MAESAGDLASPAPAPEPGSFFGALPEDVLSAVYAVLPAYSLRAAAATSRAWRDALRAAPDAVRRRAQWLHRWTAAGAGAPRGPPPPGLAASGASARWRVFRVTCTFLMSPDGTGRGRCSRQQH